MKTFFFCCMAVLVSSVAIAEPEPVAKGSEPVSANMAKFEVWSAKIAEENLMRYLACAYQHYLDGKSPQVGSECSVLLGEGGLSGLIVNRSKVAADVLARMVALGLDGALSEGRGCATIMRGKPMLARLNRLDPGKARAACEDLFNRVKGDGSEFPGVKAENVCNSVEHTREIRDEYRKAISDGQQCEPWAFD